MGQSEQCPVFRLREEALELAQHGLFGFPICREFSHHATTEQCPAPFIELELFCLDSLFDARDFFLERLPLFLLLLDQFLLLRLQLGELIISIRHLCSSHLGYIHA